MQPFMLFAKKRYAYQCWTQYGEPEPKLQQKGTQVIRRDTCRFARNALQDILELIIKKDDQEEALRYTRQVVSDLLSGKVDIENLVLTKSLKSNYHNENIPHVRLAKRMQLRNDVFRPSPGDRMQYLHVDCIDKAIDLEHPTYVSEMGLRVDFKHYFEKQLKTPLDMIWGLIMEPEKVYLDIVKKSDSNVKKSKDVEGFLRLFHVQ